MRTILALTVLAAMAAYAVIRTLPESEAEADAHVVAPTSQQVMSVSFDGRDLPVGALREAVATHPGELLDETKLDHDRRAIDDSLAAQGYLAARVAPAQVTFGAGGGAFVTWAITAGPQYRVRAVTLTGATERDAGVVTIASGELVDLARIEHTRAAIAERLAVRGKPGRVVTELHRDDAAGVVDIDLVAR